MKARASRSPRLLWRVTATIAVVMIAVGVLPGCPAPFDTTMPSDVVFTVADASGDPSGTIRAVSPGTAYVSIVAADQNGADGDGSYDAAFVLSVDGDLATTGDNYAIDGDYAIALGREDVIEVTMEATDGTTFAAGTYTLFVTVDSGDDITANNTHSIPLEIGSVGSPDVEVSVTAHPSTFLPGETYRVDYRLTNTGYNEVPQDTETMVMVNALIGSTTVDFGHDNFTLEESLLPGQSVERHVEATMRTRTELAGYLGVTEAQLAAGPQAFDVRADHTDTVVEVVEGDIDTFSATIVGNAYPEFSVASLNVAGGYALFGDTAEFELVLRNDGFSPSGEYSLRLFVDLDSNGAYDHGDVTILDWTTEETPLVPTDTSGSGNNVVSVLGRASDVVWPDTVPEGTLYLRAEIAAETDTLWTTTDGLTRAVRFLADSLDLTINTLTGTATEPIDAAAGGTVPVTYTLRNSGDDDVTAGFAVQFHGTHDRGGPDIDLGSDSVTATVPAGSAITETFDLVFDPGTAAGFYSVGWDVDATGVVAETDEGNNAADGESVFVPVSDGSTTYRTNIVFYKPRGTDPDDYVHIYARTDTPRGGAGINGYARVPGTRLTADSYAYLDPGDEISISIENRGSVPAPVAYRVIPASVSHYDLPAYSIPAWPIPNDRTMEPNDTEDDAYALPVSMNPMLGWVPAYLAGDDTFDFVTSVVP